MQPKKSNQSLAIPFSLDHACSNLEAVEGSIPFEFGHSKALDYLSSVFDGPEKRPFTEPEEKTKFWLNDKVFCHNKDISPRTEVRDKK